MRRRETWQGKHGLWLRCSCSIPFPRKQDLCDHTVRLCTSVRCTDALPAISEASAAGRVSFTAGLDDLQGLFQSKCFYDSLISLDNGSVQGEAVGRAGLLSVVGETTSEQETCSVPRTAKARCPPPACKWSQFPIRHVPHQIKDIQPQHITPSKSWFPHLTARGAIYENTKGVHGNNMEGFQ